MEPTESAFHRPLPRGPQVSRRTVIRGATLTALTGAVLGEAAVQALPARAAPAAAPIPLLTTPQSPLALPILGDAVNMDQPKYYDTIQAGTRRINRTRQSADLDGDGSDELVIRGPGGILAYRFDTASGQWWDLLGDAPTWSDLQGWGEPQYYETIQTADLDGDSNAELIGHGPDGIDVWRYDPVPIAGVSEWTRVASASGATLLDDDVWRKPEYYSTMQCADIDGDGRAELLVRGPDGLMAWRLEADDTWSQLPTLTDLSDANDWVPPANYSTIQCADIDPGTGTGHASVLARGTDALLAWTFDGSTWQPLPSLTGLSNANGWDDPSLYSTLQCADVDGDGRDELLGRGGDGLRTWRLTSSGWEEIAFLPELNDGAGWDERPYNATIQCADLDGDGRAELMARSAAGIRVWDFTGDAGTNSGQWVPGPDGPAWADADGWDQVQYYATIQTASVARGTDPARAILLGRTSSAIDTWELVDGAWRRASADWPAIADDPADEAAIIAAVNAALGIGDPNGPRGQYNNAEQSGNWVTWADAVLPIIVRPSGVDQGVWDAAIAQFRAEFQWVAAVQRWYSLLSDLIDRVNTQNQLTLTSLAGDLTLSEEVQSSTSWILDVVSLIADIGASLLGFGELFKAVEKAFSAAESIAGTVSAVCLTASEFLENGLESDGTISGTLTVLEDQLGQLWTRSSAIAVAQPGAITGGSNVDDNTYVPGDYGLLAAMGGQMRAGVAPKWTWGNEATANALLGMLQGYALNAWQMFQPATNWAWSINLQDCRFRDPSYADYVNNQWYWWPIPDARVRQPFRTDKCSQYFVVDTKTGNLIESALMQKLAGPRSTETLYPLGVSTEDVLRARSGWSRLSWGGSCAVIQFSVNNPPCGTKPPPNPRDLYVTGIHAPIPPVTGGTTALGSATTSTSTTASTDAAPKEKKAKKAGRQVTPGPRGERPISPTAPVAGVDLHVLPLLTKNEAGEIVVELEVTNRGRTPATNVEVTQLAVRGRSADGYLRTRHHRVDAGDTVRFHHRLAPLPGKPGQLGQVQIRLDHLTGSHVQRFDVLIP